MMVLWAVPLLAAVAALALVLARMRALEELSRDLEQTVRRSAELRISLRGVRRELERSESLVDRVWSHWDDDADEPAPRR